MFLLIVYFHFYSQVEYEKIPGWQSDISSIKNFSDLPKAARDYVERIEELVGVPVHYIGIGLDAMPLHTNENFFRSVCL